jgi:hypothetical protein
MYAKLIQKTLRVPRRVGPAGDGSAVARQLDAVLLSVGFSATSELLTYVSELNPADAMDMAVDAVSAVRELVGDQVQHNSYFINFPHGVPDTMEFWAQSIRDALVPAGASMDVETDEDMNVALFSFLAPGGFNLLTLPNYGRYQHSFGDLLAAHDELIASRKDRITVLHLGDRAIDELERVYLQLAASTVPLGEDDLEWLGDLVTVSSVQPTSVPMRESRAVINVVRLPRGKALIVDTVTDVLRVAVLASKGDVSLQTPTAFENFTRRERRVLLAALHNVVSADDNKLADVHRFAERWKRLSKALHPADYPQYARAADVFAVARGDLKAPSIAARAEAAFRAGNPARAARVLSAAPGLLLRSLDRLLRDADYASQDEIVAQAAVAMKSASGRVLLSLREHLVNRATSVRGARVFVGRSKRAWVTPDERGRLAYSSVSRLVSAIDTELLERLPSVGHLVVDPEVLGMALPLSGKASAAGFAVLPRGSRSRIEAVAGDELRFFVYWREQSDRTDYDLSLLMLDGDFNQSGFVSWTNYSDKGMVYSGDIVESRYGATEFIDVQLDMVRSEVRYLVPQVNIYAGESFEDVAESMFGWMLRNKEQRGMPFEAKTVRTRSEMRGAGQVALPIMFVRNSDDTWSAVWTHLYLKGQAGFNRVESNRLSTGLLARGIVSREYLTMEYLANLLSEKADQADLWVPGMKLDGPVTFVGREAPDGLPEGSDVFAGERLSELLPG